MRTIYRNIVSALILSKDNKLLMGMKDPQGGGVYADCWHIPGGGIDDGEDELQALGREIHEEVGIDITIGHTILIDSEGRGETERILKPSGENVLCKMEFHVYQVNIDLNPKDIQTRPGDDLVKLEWVDLSELARYKLTPPSVTLFNRLELVRHC
jgi:8-oxo-dGTP pyrophosphatase MutT (NUDIX family)